MSTRPNLPAYYPIEIDLGTYIVERWKQLGVGHVFGVPGDFNLGFLDYIEEDPEINWVGTASELGAGYACDGYARVKRDLSVLVTTYGVGETSTFNPICGMQAERTPCLHLVGLPSTLALGEGRLLHHTLGDGRMRVFERMMREVAGVRDGCEVIGMGVGKEEQEERGSWVEVVDRVIKVALKERRPVYLGLPQDLVSRKVLSESLYISLRESVHESTHTSSTKTDELVRSILDRVGKASNPVLVGDFYAQRFGLGDGLRRLCEGLGVRFFGTNLAKAMLDEQSLNYGGIYAGKTSDAPAREEVESSDLCLLFGRMDGDINTGMFSSKYPENTISFNLEDLVMDGQTHSLDMRTMIDRLISLAQESSMFPRVTTERMVVPDRILEELEALIPDDRLTHERFWGRMEGFFRDDDVIFSDVGTSSMGLVNVKMPTRAQLHFQHMWASIGWSGGAVLGGALAARETPDRNGNTPRTIVFIGDGALQMTLQEIGSLIRNRLPVYFFINNNNGYEIERQIHGPNAKYNDIQTYDHQLLIRALAGPLYDEVCETYKVQTRVELERLISDPSFHTGGKFRMIEFCLPRGDAPRALKMLQGGFNVPDRLRLKPPSRPMTPVQQQQQRIPSRPSTPVSALRKERPIGPFTVDSRGVAF